MPHNHGPALCLGVGQGELHVMDGHPQSSDRLHNSLGMDPASSDRKINLQEYLFTNSLLKDLQYSNS